MVHAPAGAMKQFPRFPRFPERCTPEARIVRYCGGSGMVSTGDPCSTCHEYPLCMDYRPTEISRIWIEKRIVTSLARRLRRHEVGAVYCDEKFASTKILSSLPRTANSATKPPPASMPAPRILVRRTENGHAIEPARDDPVDLDAFRGGFLAAFGTTELAVAEALFQQLLNGLHSDPLQPVNSATANLSLALMHSIGPKDEIEAMLGCQMIVAHVAAMDASRRALHAEQSAWGPPSLSQPRGQADDALRRAARRPQSKSRQGDGAKSRC